MEHHHKFALSFAVLLGLSVAGNTLASSDAQFMGAQMISANTNLSLAEADTALDMGVPQVKTDQDTLGDDNGATADLGGGDINESKAGDDPGGADDPNECPPRACGF